MRERKVKIDNNTTDYQSSWEQSQQEQCQQCQRKCQSEKKLEANKEKRRKKKLRDKERKNDNNNNNYVKFDRLITEGIMKGVTIAPGSSATMTSDYKNF